MEKDNEICLVCNENKEDNGLIVCSECNERGLKIGREIEEKHYLTQVEGEEPVVRIFGLIPDGYEGELSNLEGDDEIYYWLNRKEWENLKTGQVYGDAVILEGDDAPEPTINDIKRQIEENAQL